jgi:hypothetical protein
METNNGGQPHDPETEDEIWQESAPDDLLTQHVEYGFGDPVVSEGKPRRMSSASSNHAKHDIRPMIRDG